MTVYKISDSVLICYLARYNCYFSCIISLENLFGNSEILALVNVMVITAGFNVALIFFSAQVLLCHLSVKLKIIDNLITSRYFEGFFPPNQDSLNARLEEKNPAGADLIIVWKSSFSFFFDQ